MSTSLPTGVRALLGLAALAVEEVRKLPETLPTAMTTVPVGALSNAMQASLKFQQQLAMLAAKGDEVIGQFKSAPSEPPEWATFDEDEPPGDSRPLAAFERIDYDDVGFAESADEPGRWDAVSAPGFDAEDITEPETPTKPARAKKKPAQDTAATPAPAKKAPAAKAPAKKTAAKKTPAKKAAAAASLAESILPAAELDVPGADVNLTGPAVAQPPAGPAVPGS